MKKSILFGMVVVFLAGLLSTTAFAGAPPGAGGPPAAPGGPMAGGKRGGIGFELGYYTPSLKTLNDDMKLVAFPEIGGNLLLTLKAIFAPPGAYPYVGIGYWASSATREIDKDELKVTLIPISFGVQIPILKRTLPEQLMLSIDVGGDLPISLLHFEHATGEYYTAMALGYDIGTKVGCEYFVLPNLSLGGFIGYTFLGKTGQLSVTSGDIYDVDTKITTLDGEKMVFELSGINLMFAIRLWF